MSRSNKPFKFSMGFNFLTDSLWIKNNNSAGVPVPPPTSSLLLFANGNNFTFANGNHFQL